MSKVDNCIKEMLLHAEDNTFCCHLLLAITFNCEDWKWVQNTCIEIINSNKDPDLCGLAATCIGHVARIHGIIEKDKVFAVFEKNRDNPYVKDSIDNAMDDIKQFCLK